MHYAVNVRSGVGLQLVSFIILRGIELEIFGCATLRLYKINCPNSFKVVNVRLGSTNEMEAAWLVSYVLIVKVVSYVFKRVIAYCVQTSEMFRLVWSKTLFVYSYGQLCLKGSSEKMQIPTCWNLLGHSTIALPIFVLYPGSILEQFLSHLAFIPTRKNVSFIFVSFTSSI